MPLASIFIFSLLFVPLLVQAADFGAGAILSLALIFGIPLLFIGVVIGLIFIRKLSPLLKLALLIVVYILIGVVLRSVFSGTIIGNILIWPIDMWNKVLSPLILIIRSH